MSVPGVCGSLMLLLAVATAVLAFAVPHFWPLVFVALVVAAVGVMVLNEPPA